jgi:NAD(P)-dependent dehydrogenase (short-subunit alcohol dehydrogenase family)
MVGGLADYRAAKAAMLAFSKSIELAADGILVNAVCRGSIRTPLWETLVAQPVPAVAPSAEEVFDTLARQTLAIPRFGRAEEISALVAFLSSEQASFIPAVPTTWTVNEWLGWERHAPREMVCGDPRAGPQTPVQGASLRSCMSSSTPNAW